MPYSRSTQTRNRARKYKTSTGTDIPGFINLLHSQSTNWADAIDDDVTHFQPALERQDLEQRQHGVADVVEVKISRVSPEIGPTLNADVTDT